ncbi:AEC family transporter [Undibacterium arcticum]
MLFYSTARTTFDFLTVGKLVQTALAALALGIACGWLAKPLFRPGAMLFESGVQTAFRFNSYIGLALASRLAGEHGTALMAVLIGFAVPLCNAAAVHALVHKKRRFAERTGEKNPLLIAAAGGTAYSLLGLQLPEVAGAILSRMGSASIALGLIAVGAGLRLSGLHQARGLAAYFFAVKLLLVPAAAFILGRWAGLPQPQLQIVVIFCALPTASSCYVLAARLGGNGPYVAFLVSASTLLSVATLPLWLALVH